MKLLVLMVPDAGLRSALVGRLSLLGESLVTLTGTADDRALNGIAPAPATLIVDDAAVGDRLTALREDPRWHGLIVLADAAASTPVEERFRILDREHAINDIAGVLAGWRELEAA